MYAMVEIEFIMDCWRLHNLHASPEYILTAFAFQMTILVSFVCFLQTKSRRSPNMQAASRGSFLTSVAVMCLLISLIMERQLLAALFEAKSALVR